jgi:23S rRNA (cytidine1920-2'-O)/16S rRNA (cytidine1409-2'-O)-methyltransferase
MRLDQHLLGEQHFKSREKAKQSIEAGEVLVNGIVCTKASKKVQPQDSIELTNKEKFVSRSGHKLLAALEQFKVDVEELTCLDIGSSTGGFTQCLLKKSAYKVISVDVGTKQMHPSISENPKVELHENTDFRKFESPNKFDIIVIDVSFISLQKIIPHLKKFTTPNSIILTLFKPQFEVGKEHLKKGICRHPNIQEVIDEFGEFIVEHNLHIKKQIKVPLKGKGGNQEYFLQILN